MRLTSASLHAVHVGLLLSFVAAACPVWGQFPTVLNVPPETAPDSIGPGVQVNLLEGGLIETSIDAFDGSEVNILGGNVGADVNMFDGSVVNISGGEVGRRVRAFGSGEVNISGGAFVDLEAFSGSSVRLTGGSMTGLAAAHFGSHWDIHGIAFLVDGVNVSSSLAANTPTVVADRDVTLSGQLLDGAPFSLELNREQLAGADYFSDDAVLRITLVNRPGDFNLDGVAQGTDFLLWQRGESPQRLSDADLALWQLNFGAAPLVATAPTRVPEPTTSLLLIAAATTIALQRFAAMPRG